MCHDFGKCGLKSTRMNSKNLFDELKVPMIIMHDNELVK